MARVSWQRMKEILDSALDQPPADRAAYLDDACAKDLRLRSEVQSLLDAHDQDASFLESPILHQPFDLEEVSRWANPDRVLLGEQVSGWRLNRVIASGGMGTVYEASNTEDDEVVAIKLMRFGRNSESARRRFAHEASVLSRLNHGGIARIFDVGSHDTGMGEVPFFAMEYVRDALPLTEYASTHGLNTQERLELFIQICPAVEHGHQKGIVHRDLKPGNILVDADGRPKVIDFGVAQATDVDLAATTMHTDVGQLIGTLPYMSPEQCAGDPGDIDTRSDVYSLGVVLFELLTGSLPYDLHGVPLTDAMKIVRDHPAARPSSHNQTLSGDLDTILLKALEKDRERRYGSVAELEMDVRRHLAHEPITARPPSVTYQLRKFCRRNKGLVVGSSATVLALIGVVVVLTWKNAEVRDALKKVTEANRAIVREQEATRLAQRRTDRINEFLRLDVLWSVAPSELGPDARMRDVLDAAAERVDEQFDDEPLIAADLHRTIGSTYAELGEYEQAELHLRRSFDLYRDEAGEGAVSTIGAATELAAMFVTTSRYDEAIAVSDAAIAEARASLGVHEATGMALNPRGRAELQVGDPAVAEVFFRDALEILQATLGESHTETGETMSNLAVSLRLQGRLDEAQPILEEAIAILKENEGPENALTLTLRNNLGILLWTRKDYEGAIVLFEELLPELERAYPLNHSNTLGARSSLAMNYHGAGRLDEARRIFEELLPLMRAELGPTEWTTLFTLNSLARLYRDLELFEEARLAFEELVDGCKATLGHDHRNTLRSMAGLADLLTSNERHEDAREVFVEFVAAAKGRYTNEHSITIRARINFASRCLVPLRDFAEAERQLSVAHESATRVDGQAANARAAIGELVSLYDAWDKPDKAAEWRAKLKETTNDTAGEESSQPED